MLIVTDVPDLHTARILSAAGVESLSMLQSNIHFTEIRSWLEGVKVGAEIMDINLSIPQADFLIVPKEWQDHFLYSDYIIYWKQFDTILFNKETIHTISAEDWLQSNL